VAGKQQLKIEEKQRVLGIIRSILCQLCSACMRLLTAKQKFKLAMRTVWNPVYVPGGGRDCGSGAGAKITFFEYGQGAEGYASRFGPSYADTVYEAVHWRGHSSVAAETNPPALFLQRNGKQRNPRFCNAIACR